MSEYLCCCDENLYDDGAYPRDIVHSQGILHKTSHVWLYDSQGYVYFQVRADSNKLYTSASGHVLANETPILAAIRETEEELGYKVAPKDLELIRVVKWQFDNEIRHDHVFAYVYLCELPNNYCEFSVNPTEVSGIVKVKADELLSTLYGVPFVPEQFDVHNKKIKPKDLLLMEGENPILKYGDILNEVVKRTNG